MKKLVLVLTMLLITSVSFAEEKTKVDKKQTEQKIQVLLLKKENIELKSKLMNIEYAAILKDIEKANVLLAEEKKKEQ